MDHLIRSAHALILLLALGVLVGCRKHEPITCDAIRYLEPQDGGRGPIKPISDPDWAGVVVPVERIQSKPKYLTFHDAKRVTADWLSYGHVWTIMDLAYSPGELKARVVKPESSAGDAYSIVMSGEGKARYLKLGFFSTLCEQEDSAPQCAERSGLKFFVVEMKCGSQVSRPPG